VVKYTKRPGGARDEVTMLHLQRLATDDRGERVIFRERPGMPRPERVGVATIEAPAQWTLDTDNGAVTVNLDDVRDFTACHLVAMTGGGGACWRSE
jgi:hypothetical protein